MKSGHGFLTFFEFLRNMWLILAESDILSDYAEEDHGDRLFEVNSTNSFKNLSP